MARPFREAAGRGIKDIGTRAAPRRRPDKDRRSGPRESNGLHDDESPGDSGSSARNGASRNIRSLPRIPKNRTPSPAGRGGRKRSPMNDSGGRFREKRDNRSKDPEGFFQSERERVRMGGQNQDATLGRAEKHAESGIALTARPTRPSDGRRRVFGGCRSLPQVAEQLLGRFEIAEPWPGLFRDRILHREAVQRCRKLGLGGGRKETGLAQGCLQRSDGVRHFEDIVGNEEELRSKIGQWPGYFTFAPDPMVRRSRVRTVFLPTISSGL